jgi:hypothetical protein
MEMLADPSIPKVVYDQKVPGTDDTLQPQAQEYLEDLLSIGVEDLLLRAESPDKTTEAWQAPIAKWAINKRGAELKAHREALAASIKDPLTGSQMLSALTELTTSVVLSDNQQRITDKYIEAISVGVPSKIDYILGELAADTDNPMILSLKQVTKQLEAVAEKLAEQIRITKGLATIEQARPFLGRWFRDLYSEKDNPFLRGHVLDAQIAAADDRLVDAKTALAQYTITNPVAGKKKKTKVHKELEAAIVAAQGDLTALQEQKKYRIAEWYANPTDDAGRPFSAADLMQQNDGELAAVVEILDQDEGQESPDVVADVLRQYGENSAAGAYEQMADIVEQGGGNLYGNKRPLPMKQFYAYAKRIQHRVKFSGYTFEEARKSFSLEAGVQAFSALAKEAQEVITHTESMREQAEIVAAKNPEAKALWDSLTASADTAAWIEWSNLVQDGSRLMDWISTFNNYIVPGKLSTDEALVLKANALAGGGKGKALKAAGNELAATKLRMKKAQDLRLLTKAEAVLSKWLAGGANEKFGMDTPAFDKNTMVATSEVKVALRDVATEQEIGALIDSVQAAVKTAAKNPGNTLMAKEPKAKVDRFLKDKRKAVEGRAAASSAGTKLAGAAIDRTQQTINALNAQITELRKQYPNKAWKDRSEWKKATAQLKEARARLAELAEKAADDFLGETAGSSLDSQTINIINTAGKAVPSGKAAEKILRQLTAQAARDRVALLVLDPEQTQEIIDESRSQLSEATETVSRFEEGIAAISSIAASRRDGTEPDAESARSYGAAIGRSSPEARAAQAAVGVLNPFQIALRDFVVDPKPKAPATPSRLGPQRGLKLTGKALLEKAQARQEIDPDTGKMRAVARDVALEIEVLREESLYNEWIDGADANSKTALARDGNVYTVYKSGKKFVVYQTAARDGTRSAAESEEVQRFDTEADAQAFVGDILVYDAFTYDDALDFMDAQMEALRQEQIQAIKEQLMVNDPLQEGGNEALYELGKGLEAERLYNEERASKIKKRAAPRPTRSITEGRRAINAAAPTPVGNYQRIYNGGLLSVGFPDAIGVNEEVQRILANKENFEQLRDTTYYVTLMTRDQFDAALAEQGIVGDSVPTRVDTIRKHMAGMQAGLVRKTPANSVPAPVIRMAPVDKGFTPSVLGYNTAMAAFDVPGIDAIPVVVIKPLSETTFAERMANDVNLSDLSNSQMRTKPKTMKSTDGNTSTVESVWAELRKSGYRTKQWFANPNSSKPLFVVQTVKELQAKLKSQGYKVPLAEIKTAGGYYIDGKTYMVADNIAPGRVMGVLVHEVAHHKLDKAATSRLAVLIRSWASSNAGREGKFARDAMLRAAADKQVLNETGRIISKEHYDSELVAYFAQVAVENGVLITGPQYTSVSNNMLTYMNSASEQAPTMGLTFVDFVGYLGKMIVDAIKGVTSMIDPASLRTEDVLSLLLAPDSPMRNNLNSGEGMASRMYDAALVQRAADSMWENLPDSSKFASKTFGKMVRKVRMGLSFSHILKGIGSRVFSQIPEGQDGAGDTHVALWYQKTNERQHERGLILTNIMDIMAPISKMPTAERVMLARFMAKSTVAESWAFDPTMVDGMISPPDPQNIDPVLAEEFNGMTAPQQEAIIAVFTAANNLQTLLQATLNEQIVSTYTKLIDRQTDFNAQQELIAERDAALRESNSRVTRRQAAWLPLKRHGRYMVVYKSDEYRAEEAAGNPSSSLLKQYKADRAHYFVHFDESFTNAQRVEQYINQQNAEMGLPPANPASERMAFGPDSERVTYNFVTRLRAQLQEEVGMTVDGDRSRMSVNAIATALEKVYIKQLEDTSIRTSELERIAVAGYNEDMLRSFEDFATGAAAMIAAIKTQSATQDSLQALRNEAVRDAPGQNERIEILNEILDRHALTLEYEPSPLGSKVMGFTSIWLLLTSPAYYMQNLMQPAMLTLPKLSARWGGSATSKVMTQSYKDIRKAWKSANTLSSLSLTAIKNEFMEGELFNIDQIQDADIRDLLHAAKVQNKLDVGISAELGSLRTKVSAGFTGEDSAVMKGTALLSSAHRRMVHAVRSVEVINRAVTLTSAYKLHFAKHGNKAAATTYALDMSDLTQGDYSEEAAPSFFRKVPRFMLQFRKFQLIQLTLLGVSIRQAMKGATKEERHIARKELLYVLGMHGAIGGAMALPGMGGMVGFLLAFAFGEDDEDKNIEAIMRKRIGNREVADVLMNGIPAWAGINATNKLGMGTTLSILPFTDISIANDGLLTALGAAAGGPAAGQGLQFARGADMLANGHIELGVAQMLPKGLKDILKAHHASTQGISLRNAGRDQLLSAEDIGLMEALLMGTGWSAQKITNAQNVGRWKRSQEEVFAGVADDISGKYIQARREGDQEAIREARTEWTRYQASRVREGFKRQPMTTLTGGYKRAEKRGRQVLGGVQYDRGNKGFVEQFQ